MLDTLSILPFSFWVAVAVLVFGGVQGFRNLQDGSGIPLLAVLGTISVWYVGDALYNDYGEAYVPAFRPDILQNAWWYVAWFLVVFLVAYPIIFRWLNHNYLARGSGVLRMFQHGVALPNFQQQMKQMFLGCAMIWGALTVVAAIRLHGEIIYYLFPFLDHKAEPWGRNRIGGGFDALLSLALYVDQLAAATFGVVAALSTYNRIRFQALMLCFLSWPYFIFDRTRYTIVATVMPATVCWIFLRYRGGMMKKLVALLACFLMISAWFKFIIANRSDLGVMQALKEKGFTFLNAEKVHHEGLNMFEELCWSTTFLQQGTLQPNWGMGYLAEMENVIPRTLWPGKPTIGIAYAIARGQGGGDSAGAGVYSTISTGLIGQGVVNFGQFFGPAAAALIVSFWAAIVARLDLTVERFGHLPLYATGLFVTFIIGRDFSIQALYPFIFGTIIIWVFEKTVRRQPEYWPGNRVPASRLVSGGGLRAKRFAAMPVITRRPIRFRARFR
jgi:hypothetical protein